MVARAGDRPEQVVNEAFSGPESQSSFVPVILPLSSLRSNAQPSPLQSMPCHCPAGPLFCVDMHSLDVSRPENSSANSRQFKMIFQECCVHGVNSEDKRGHLPSQNAVLGRGNGGIASTIFAKIKDAPWRILLQSLDAFFQQSLIMKLSRHPR